MQTKITPQMKSSKRTSKDSSVQARQIMKNAVQLDFQIEAQKEILIDLRTHVKDSYDQLTEIKKQSQSETYHSIAASNNKNYLVSPIGSVIPRKEIKNYHTEQQMNRKMQTKNESSGQFTSSYNSQQKEQTKPVLDLFQSDKKMAEPVSKALQTPAAATRTSQSTAGNSVLLQPGNSLLVQVAMQRTIDAQKEYIRALELH